MTTTHIPLMVMLVALSGASKSMRDSGRRMKTAIIPRIPFGKAERAIFSAYGQKYGLQVDVVFVRSAIQAAALVMNGSVDIASAGVMTSYFSGSGRF